MVLCIGMCAFSWASPPGHTTQPPAPALSTRASESVQLADAGAATAGVDAARIVDTTPSRIDLAPAAIEQRLRDSAAYLSSDELEGRGIRTRGLDLAADYLAREFAAAGLRTDLYDGTPFHEFKLYSSATKGAVQELTLHTTDDQDRALQPGRDYSSLTLSVNTPIKLPVVFAGYGITAPELKYDDYAELDAAGKAVIVLRREPQQSDPQSVFNGTELSEYAYLRAKIDNAVQHGAAMLILCTDAVALRPPIDGALPADDELLQVELADASLRETIPVVHCRRSIVEELIASSGGESLSALEAAIDDTLVPHSCELPATSVTGRVGLARGERRLRNVVAVLDATGPTAQETLIIGAHYDHLGHEGWGSLAIGAHHEIHNGADDNASGTTVLLEVARQLAARTEPLNRRILFIAFSAEELGLIGSSKYVQDPLIPLSDTVAMLNLDMVGRLRDDKLTVFGTGTAAEWPALIARADEPLGLTIKSNPGGYGPSDHASFYEHGVPVLHFFTGFHNQYHRPTDDFELLNIEGMRRIAALVSDIAVGVAQADARPTASRSAGDFDLAGLEDLDSGIAPPDDRPQLGVILAPVDGEGVLVQGLTPTAAAAPRGIRPGDVLLSFDGRPTNSAEAAIEALKAHPDNQPLKVRLKRRGIEMELEIQF